MAALVVVVVGAGLLRLPALSATPPGLHQDEAANAWNAYCLLKTGRDQVGVCWPIFYVRALGENRSALLLYVLLPFQALGGLNVWTTRLPAAVGGTLTVLLTYWVVARLFGRGTGLVAALLLAINPVHIQMSRWGHEASITPLLTLAPLAALLWARFPLDDHAKPGPRPLRAVLAGLLTGVCCYGYPAVRLFLPVFLTGCVLLTWRDWRRTAQTRRGVLALAGLLLGLAATFGPLVFKHVTEPEIIGKRGRGTWVWSSTDPLSARLGKVAERYARHFAPQFLFESGDKYEVLWARGFGFLPCYVLPVQLAGLVIIVPQLRRSRAARLLLAGVLLYPVGDCLSWHVSLHALRSSPGLVPLLTLAAVGIVQVAAFLGAHRLRVSRLALGLAFAALIASEQVRFLRSYFHDRRRQPTVYHGNHVDLLEACRWLRPRLDQVDVVICTPRDMNHPYLITLVGLGYDPQRWFAEPREVHTGGMWDRYARYGKFYFLPEAQRRALLDKLRANGRPERVVLILRPSESLPDTPTHRIVRPDGRAALLIYDTRL